MSEWVQYQQANVTLLTPLLVLCARFPTRDSCRGNNTFSTEFGVKPDRSLLK